MNKNLPLFIFVSGIAIAAIAYFGNHYTNKSSDTEILLEAAYPSGNNQSQKSVSSKTVLPVPLSCQPVKTAIVFKICENEPDVGTDAKPWRLLASEA